MAAKGLKAGGLAAMVLAAVGGYWWGSPYLAMHSLKTAAENKDAHAFSERVDYPKLRESLKGSLNAAMAAHVQKASGVSDMAAAGAAFGAALGTMFVDRMVDGLVTPENLMRAMSQAKLEAGEPKTTSVASNSDTPKDKIEWTFERNGFDRLTAYATTPGSSEAERLGLVFVRNGFADWKLSGVELPALSR